MSRTGSRRERTPFAGTRPVATALKPIRTAIKMGALANNLLHMLRQFYVMGEGVRRSIEWLIRRLIKVGAMVSYHSKRWHVHVASAFPLAHYYRAVLGYG